MLALASKVEDSEAAAARQVSVPRGTLRVATSVAFGVLQMGSAVTEYLKRYPRLQVDVALNDRVASEYLDNCHDRIEGGYWLSSGDEAGVRWRSCDRGLTRSGDEERRGCVICHHRNGRVLDSALD